jgi:hypothetical protein
MRFMSDTGDYNAQLMPRSLCACNRVRSPTTRYHLTCRFNEFDCSQPASLCYVLTTGPVWCVYVQLYNSNVTHRN